jgi:hypothetical protein
MKKWDSEESVKEWDMARAQFLPCRSSPSQVGKSTAPRGYSNDLRVLPEAIEILLDPHKAKRLSFNYSPDTDVSI